MHTLWLEKKPKKNRYLLLWRGVEIRISLGCGCVEHTSWAQHVGFRGKKGTSKSQQGAMEMNKGPRDQKLIDLLCVARG
jgi:hypothetical protein